MHGHAYLICGEDTLQLPDPLSEGVFSSKTSPLLQLCIPYSVAN